MWCHYQKMEGSSLNPTQQKPKPTNYITIHKNVYIQQMISHFSFPGIKTFDDRLRRLGRFRDRLEYLSGYVKRLLRLRWLLVLLQLLLLLMQLLLIELVLLLMQLLLLLVQQLLSHW